MIPLSPAAQAALDALTEFYRVRGRDRAIELLANNIEAACKRYQSGRRRFVPAPRVYPQLSDFGFLWTKEGPYWIAFAETASGPVVAGLFHEAADIPNRM
jgi:plasmid stabilization system protein ParE